MEHHDDQAMVEYYVRGLRRGSVDAVFSLKEAGPQLLPYLERAYHEEGSSRVRAGLVHAAWQSPSPAVVPFLAEALRDPEPDVWHEALDGLVAIASPEAATALAETLADADTAAGRKAREYREWIREALQQASAR